MTNPLATEALLETRSHSRVTLHILAETPLHFEHLLQTQQYTGYTQKNGAVSKVNKKSISC